MVQVTVPVVSNAFKASTHGRQQQSEEGIVVVESNEITNLLCAEAKQLSDLELFIAGYRSCAQEVLRYLIEDEGLSPEDPIILSVHNHLQCQEELYILQYLASAVLLGSPSSPTPPPSDIESDCEDSHPEI